MLCIVANNIALVATSILEKSVTEQNVVIYAELLPSKSKQTLRESHNSPVGEATTGIRIATAVQWRQCTIGQQDTSNQGVT